MARRVYVTGLNKVLANLNREIKKIEGRTKAGLWQAALIIQRRSMQLTPVDENNLRPSAYAHAYDTPSGPGAEIGYTASYAVFVHEVQATHKPPTQWKFLETAIKEKEKDALEAIRSKAKV